jgi:hypothetical protein
MAFQTVNVGTVADDGTGDSLRAGGQKINSNFALAVEGPASAVTDGRVVVFDGTTGRLVKQGTQLATALVSGPASVTDERIAVFDGTTGKLLKESTVAVSALLPLAGGTMTGAIVTAKQVETTVTTLGTSGTITVDLSDSMLQTTGSLSGNITSLVTSNRAAGRSSSLRIINGGTNRTVAYSSSWRWVGAKPANPFTLVANKLGVLSLTAFGTAETDIIAAWAVEP